VSIVAGSRKPRGGVTCHAYEGSSFVFFALTTPADSNKADIVIMIVFLLAIFISKITELF
jgi:hypothetical protein